MPISHSSSILMEQMLFLYAIMIERSINVGQIILKEIQNCSRKNVRSAYFPSSITSLCLRAQVKSKANLKGCYVKGCITRHVLKEEAEAEEEPNSPKLKVEPNVVELMEPSVNLMLTIPVPTSSNIMKKWEFSTMMDM
ncbi:hypothetical protein J1N35_022501 [Gossypium stocksii]|uniref:Putative plant transposon protein domain-containing protein n=1 Tax=Gossypium stocksii TaxID=47602 RepID=A0A9D3VGL0_9ROSI|nr:hypothetical protein J1N35_022501 [Gossypium stocksii]